MTDIATASDPIMQAYLQPCLATAHVPTPSDLPDAAEQAQLQLRNLAAALGDLDVAEADARRLQDAVERLGHDAGRSVVAVLGERGATAWPVEADLPAHVVGGPLPALAPLLALRQRWVPHAVVLLDRVGADVRIVEHVGDEIELTVDGADSHISKSNPGGWSQRRFQQRAEEHWHDNARQVAERLQDELAGSQVGLIVLAGDHTARAILVDLLPEHLAGMVVQVDGGGRAEDGSADAVTAAVDAAVRDAAAGERDDRAGRVVDAVGSGAGATGRTDVLEALFEGRVDTLLVVPAAAEGLTASIGPEPTQVAADAGQLHALGLDAVRVPLVDAALRGAAATGARVVVLDDAPQGVEDGLAASLRG